MIQLYLKNLKIKYKRKNFINLFFIKKFNKKKNNQKKKKKIKIYRFYYKKLKKLENYLIKVNKNQMSSIY